MPVPLACPPYVARWHMLHLVLYTCLPDTANTSLKPPATPRTCLHAADRLPDPFLQAPAHLSLPPAASPLLPRRLFHRHLGAAPVLQPMRHMERHPHHLHCQVSVLAATAVPAATLIPVRGVRPAPWPRLRICC